MRYFYLSWIEIDVPGFESAQAPKGTLGYELVRNLSGKNELPFQLILDEDAELFDYQPNTLAYPLMSESLKRIISDNLTGYEGLDWVHAVLSHRGQLVPYYIPRFEHSLDVLDPTKCVFAGKENEALVKAHLSLTKVNNYNFFPLPGLPISVSNIVSEVLKKKIEKAKLMGISFSKVAAS